MKKPSIAIVAGASTSEDVCPWESGPEPRSRKNSAQLDSGSSSSDISVAVAETSERMRRTCGLTQQNTLDGGKSSRKLSAACCLEPRRASVSVVPVDSSKRSVSSFEDSDTAASLGSANANNSVRDSVASNVKTFKKSHSLTKACSVSGTNPPIISVSAVVDEPMEVEGQSGSERGEAAQAEAGGSQPQPLAPLAEPDSESPGSEVPPDTLEEAKSNDVCPWEDE